MRYLWAAAIVAIIFRQVAAQPKQPEKKEPPRIILALPLAVELNKSSKFTVRGLHLETVQDIRVHEPRSSGKVIGKGKKVPLPNQTPADKVGDSEIEIEIHLPKEVAGATVSFTLIGPGGAESKPHPLLLIDESLPRLVEKEPNDSFKTAQAIAGPVIVEGSIRQNQDVDIFKIEGKEGDKLHCELQAARYGSPVDGVLTLFDSEGRILQTAGETSFGRDAVLKTTLPRNGTYFLSLIDANDQGGNLYQYRLWVRREP